MSETTLFVVGLLLTAPGYFSLGWLVHRHQTLKRLELQRRVFEDDLKRLKIMEPLATYLREKELP